VLGPSATWLLRRLVSELDEHPGGYELDLATTATALGLGTRSGRHSPFFRSIERCCRFGAAQQVGARGLRVRRKLPPLTRPQVERLPEALQAAHRGWVEAPGSGLAVDQPRERARGLALSLLELGEDPEATERQLHTWRVHPALAHDALRWARERQASGIARRDPPPGAA
jgi:hypothetical protein